MNIVVLDGYTTNPGDLDWLSIEQLGTLTIYDRTDDEDIYSRSQEADIILTNKTPIRAELLNKLKKLKLVCVMATGYNIVDVSEAGKLGIAVCNVVGYSTPSVVQHTFSLILELLNRVGHHDRKVKQGDWHTSMDFSFWNKSILELEGQTMGIVGFGNIGQAVARVALAFGMKVISYHKHPERDAMEGVQFMSIDELIRQSDIVSLHCPLNESNYHMLGLREFQNMKSNALLINTARGGLVDYEALLSALEGGAIEGAGLDVLENEPPLGISIPDRENLIVTPHQAWASKESRKRLLDGLASNIRAYQAGHPQNVVS